MFIFTKMIIKNHIKRSYMIIMGIACSVTMMFCIIQMGDSIINKYKEQVLGTNQYDFQIDGLTKEQADYLKEEFDKEDIEASGIIYMYFGDNVIKPEELKQMDFQICAGTKEGFEEPGMRLLDGKWSELSDELVLEQYVCDIMGSQIGDEIKIVNDLSGDTYNLKLVGIIENTPVLLSSGWTRGFMCVSFDFICDNGFVKPESEEYSLIITVDTDIDDYNIEKITELEITARERLAQMYGIDFNDAIQKIIDKEQISEEEEFCIKKINGNIKNNSSKEENIIEYKSQSEIGKALKVLIVLIAVAMIFLIFNSMHLAVTENTRELGILRCIGMNYKQTGMIIFAENFVYCFLGYGIGIILGNIVNYLAANNILYYLTGDDIKIRQLGISYILTAVVVAGSLMMAFVLSIRKIFFLTPIEASKYNGLTPKGKKVEKMEKWSAMEFAGRNIRREWGKSAIVMISMIFSMMILLLIFNTMLSIKLPEKDRKSKFSDYEVYVPVSRMIDTMEGISTARISFSEMEDVKKVFGVEKVYAIGLSLDLDENMYQKNGNMIPSIIYNDEMFKWLLKQNGESELWEKGLDSICVITGTYGEEHEKILDEIKQNGTIAYKMENGKEGIINVSSVLYADYRPEYKGTSCEPFTIILSEKCASVIYEDFSYIDMMIKFNSDADEKTKNIIIDIFKDNDYILCGSYEIGMEQIIRNTLSIIYVAVLVVIATMVTAVLNMMIIMKANLILRRKEYGIWRALGMPLTQLKKTISIEMLLMLFVSYVSAAIISFPIQCYLCVMIGNFNITGMLSVYIGVGSVLILLVYMLVMASLKFKETNQIIVDIREE